MKKIAITTACLTAALSLSACGGASLDEYCDELENAKSSFDSLDEGDFGSFDEIFDVFDDLADKAPSELEGDWKVLQDGLKDVQDLLDEAGIDAETLEQLEKGDFSNVDMAKIMEFGEKVDELDNDKLEKATDNIDKHAKDECDVELGN